MNEHIKALFEAAQPFDEGELYQSGEYDLWSKAVLRLEREIEERFGQEAKTLLTDYIYAYFEVEWLTCLHYFHQGYLAAEAAARKNETK